MDPTSEHRLPVPVAMRPWVAGIAVRSVGAGQTLVHPPDTAVTLVLQPASTPELSLLVQGVRTRAAYFTSPGEPFSLRVRIRPGRARALLGVAADRIVDRCVPLGEVWEEPGLRLSRELAALGPDPVRVVAHLESTLLARLARQPALELARGDLLAGAAASLSAAAGVRTTALLLHISERQLRHLFTGAVGVPPKRFARIGRVRAVLAAARHTSLARLAAEAGYSDQSHLSTEFRRLMGVPPGAFRAGRYPAAAACAALAPAPTDADALHTQVGAGTG